MAELQVQAVLREGWERVLARNGLMLVAGFLLVRYMSAGLSGAAGLAASPGYALVLLGLWTVAVLALAHLIVLAFRTFRGGGEETVSDPLPVEDALRVTPRLAAGLLASTLLFLVPPFLARIGGGLGVVLALPAWVGVVYVLARTMVWPVAVVEGMPLLEAVRRSWEGTAPVRWRVVGLLLALGLVMVVAQGVSAVFVSAIPNTYLSMFLQEVVAAGVTVLVIATIAETAARLDI